MKKFLSQTISSCWITMVPQNEDTFVVFSPVIKKGQKKQKSYMPSTIHTEPLHIISELTMYCILHAHFKNFCMLVDRIHNII
jgi:hypothetical protein